MAKWRDIPGYPGYKASDDGRVGFFLDGRRMAVLHQRRTPNGYMYVRMSAEGEPDEIGVHRAVAMAFIENAEGKPQVNHKNGVRDDNRVENLEWVTCSENHRHAYRVLGKVSPGKGRALHAKLTEEQVREIRVAVGTCKQVGDAYGVSPNCVCNIRKRVTWKNVS